MRKEFQKNIRGFRNEGHCAAFRQPYASTTVQTHLKNQLFIFAYFINGPSIAAYSCKKFGYRTRGCTGGFASHQARTASHFEILNFIRNGINMSNLINGLAISTMISLFSMSGMASAASVNYVVNSDFEESELKPNAWKVFSEIDGWTTTKDPGIEVQNGNVGGSTAYSENQNVELDSQGNSGMSQKIKLDTGDYFLSFAYRGRTDAPDTNSITYSFLRTGIPKDTVKGVSSEASQVFDFHSTLADATTITLKFKATETSDSFGGYPDKARVTGVPIPPAVWLFGSALMGLVGVARRQTTKV